MSLLNILTDSISGSILTNNKPLKKVSSTTLSETGNSLPDISKSLNVVAASSLSESGTNTSSVYSPIETMRLSAIASDPANTAFYNSSANDTKATIDHSTSEGIPKTNSSLFDIQKSYKSATANGVNSYGASIATVNPTLGTSVTNLGNSSLVDYNRTMDASIATSYNKTGSALEAKLSNINNALVDKVKSANLAATERDASNPNLQLLPGAYTPPPIVADTGPSKKTTADVSEGDNVGSLENNTDVIHQEIKIYVEGVQVSFEAASVTQSIGQMPTAFFQVPPQAGLLDIARYYQPKVHIFYTDKNTGGDRLLFWGHIIACNFSRSRASASASISFECVHKNELLKQITFEWSGGMGPSQTDTNPDQASAQINNFNSEASIIRALMGLNGIQSEASDLISPKNKKVNEADPTKLAVRFKDFEKRLVGMPAAIMNLWNQVKLERYSDEKLNIIFSKMFIPLLEDGVRFFDRLSGHYFLENKIQNSKVKHCNDHARPEMSKYDTMLPPAFRVDITSAVQTKMAVNNVKAQLGFSGELTNFHDMFSNFYYGVEYELLTLGSPAEVPVNPETEVTFDINDMDGWNAQNKMAIETIVKPQTPFYYSPMCNVILPNMIISLDVHQTESDIPTRVTAIGTASSQANNDPNVLGVNYRAPYSIREAIAIGRNTIDGGTSSLKDTTGSSFNIPGKYEMGRGIKHRKLVMPDWLAHFTKDEDAGRATNSDQAPPDDPLAQKNLANLHSAWIDRYGKVIKHDEDNEQAGYSRDATLDTLDPYSMKAGIMAYERILFSTADYEYTKEVVRAKTGSVTSIFNPYIIPGYPMDIIDSSPNNPSFHAMCSSVTHSFSSRSISTSIGFMAAISYTEMYNYYLQPLHPWLQNALSMINVARTTTSTEVGATDMIKPSKPTPDPLFDAPNLPYSSDVLFNLENSYTQRVDQQQTLLSDSHGITPDPAFDSNSGDVSKVVQGLIDNPRAKEAADNFYSNVLGVGSADPSQLFDFATGMVKPLARSGGIWVEGSEDSVTTENGGQLNDNLTAVGNLRLVTRPIEGKKSIENKFEIKFIDLTPQNYNVTSITYNNKVLSSADLLEPGASMFLDYQNVADIVAGV